MTSEQAFKRILVPTDGSVPSEVAQELAAFIAKKFQSKVTVVHVVAHELMKPGMEDFSLGGADTDIPSAGITRGDYPIPTQLPRQPSTYVRSRVANELLSWHNERGEEIIGEAVALFKEEGIEVDEKMLQHADPAETILQEAEDGEYDLIIMGSNGEDDEDMHLGSVAHKVSRHAQIPVLIVRQKRKISKILVPVDGSKRTAGILQEAVVLSKKTGAKMTLLYVQESSLFRLRPQASKEIGTHILANAAAQAKGVEADQKMESGDPAKIIMQTAKAGDYDLVVMGNKGHSTVGRFLLGGTVEHVIHYIDRPVLLVK
jgi:nucleotide-binding universal stress UspA family protein